MSLTEPKDSKWTAWFWLTVLFLTLISVVGGIAYLVFALWRSV